MTITESCVSFIIIRAHVADTGSKKNQLPTTQTMEKEANKMLFSSIFLFSNTLLVLSSQMTYSTRGLSRFCRQSLQSCAFNPPQILPKIFAVDSRTFPATNKYVTLLSQRSFQCKSSNWQSKDCIQLLNSRTCICTCLCAKEHMK